MIDVLNLYRKGKKQEFIPMVTEQNICCGIVCKDQFLEKLLTSQYGLDLYGRKPISEFITNRVLSFEVNTLLEEVSKQITSNTKADPAFIINEGGSLKA